MKTFKRFSAILIAVLLMVSMMVIPASADTPPYTITIDSGDGAEHIYEAYQIFAGTLSADGKILSDITWGTGVVNGETNFGDASVKAASLTSSTLAQTFADQLIPCLSSTKADSTYNSDTKKHTISLANAGYYLIRDVSVNPVGGYNAYSDYVLRVVANVTVTPKSSMPKLSVRVSRDGENSGYTEGVSASIGKQVWFELKGSMPALIDDYTTYEMTFTDVLPSFLDYVVGSAKVWVVNNNQSSVYKQIENPDAPGTPYYTVSFDDVSKELSVRVLDAKEAIYDETGVDALTQDNIVVTFAATVNSSVGLTSDGNPNSAVMKFANNPNDSSKYGTTNPVSAKVFSYELDLKKVNSSNQTLPNAEFVVYRWKNASEKEYLCVNGATTVTGEGLVTGGAADKAGATRLITDGNGLIKIKGVSSGTYHFEEITAPDSYNKLGSEVSMELSASLNGATGDLDQFSATITDTTGMSSASAEIQSGTKQCIATITVTNTTNAELPSTGGIGTTIFYTIGGVLVIGALSLLIVRKRTGAK